MLDMQWSFCIANPNVTGPYQKSYSMEGEKKGLKHDNLHIHKQPQLQCHAHCLAAANRHTAVTLTSVAMQAQDDRYWYLTLVLCSIHCPKYQNDKAMQLSLCHVYLDMSEEIPHCLSDKT